MCVCVGVCVGTNSNNNGGKLICFNGLDFQHFEWLLNASLACLARLPRLAPLWQRTMLSFLPWLRKQVKWIKGWPHSSGQSLPACSPLPPPCCRLHMFGLACVCLMRKILRWSITNGCPPPTHTHAHIDTPFKSESQPHYGPLVLRCHLSGMLFSCLASLLL